jgi:hypothetical protein
VGVGLELLGQLVATHVVRESEAKAAKRKSGLPPVALVTTLHLLRNWRVAGLRQVVRESEAKAAKGNEALPVALVGAFDFCVIRGSLTRGRSIASLRAKSSERK